MSRMQVTFKHENTIDGVPVGPCVVIDLDAADADPVVNSGSVGMPYGYKPAWQDERGWMGEPQAAAIAAECGVELQRW